MDKHSIKYINIFIYKRYYYLHLNLSKYLCRKMNSIKTFSFSRNLEYLDLSIINSFFRIFSTINHNVSC